MNTPPTHQDQLDLWKYFSDDAAKVKEKLWTMASWLFTSLSVVLGYVAQNLDGHGSAFKEPQIIIVVAGVGLVLSIYTCWMIYESGIHLRTAWNRTNHLRSQLPQVEDAWQAGRKKKDGDIKEEYSEDLPPFVIRLMVLGCLFALALLIVLIAAVIQDSFTTSIVYNTKANSKMNYNIDLAAIIAALFWPVVALVVLFSKRFKTLVESLSSRITNSKIEFAGVSFDLTFAFPFQPEKDLQYGDLTEKLGADDIDNSYTYTLNAKLVDVKQADYVILNLGKGLSWLTSRIFILSILFKQAKGIKAIVFLHSTDRVKKDFLGWVSIEEMRWSLAMKYPHLERAYKSVYCEEIKKESIKTENGSIGNNSVWNPPTAELLNSFVEKIQSSESKEKQLGWVKIQSSNGEKYEQASWVTDILLRNIAGDELQTESIAISELRAKSDREKAVIIANMEGQYVPVVNHEGRFEYLIDRYKLLEKFAIQTLKP